jgi:hypothetical protein
MVCEDCLQTFYGAVLQRILELRNARCERLGREE